MESSYTPSPQGTGTFPGLGQPVQPSPKKDKSKVLLWTLIGSGAFLVVLLIAAVIWAALLNKDKEPASTPTASNKIMQYYYADTLKAGPEASVPSSFTYTLGQITPETNKISKVSLTSALPFVSDQPIQFSGDGKTYVYANSARTDGDSADVPKDRSFQLVVGTMPQNPAKEKTVVSDNRHFAHRDWLMTADGKEVVYVDTILEQKEVQSQILYSIDTATGKVDRIGDVSRPTTRDNTHLSEVVKDKTVNFYTSMEDGIYKTTYDRTARKVSNKKVVLKDYDFGSMGQVSPDGTKMIYFGGSPDATPNFTLYLLDLVRGGVTPLIKTPSKYGGYAGGFWSPDSKAVVITSQLKDIDGAHYKNQLLTVDTVAKATHTETLVENTSPTADNNRSFYMVTGWSSDKRYITYLQDSKLYFYDTVDKKLLPKLMPSSPVTLIYPTISGWLSIDR